MRALFVAVSLIAAGCRFDPAGVAGDDQPAFDAAAPLDAALDGGRPATFCADDPDLVACYRFDAADATEPHDDSAYGNDGIATAITFPDGHHGKAMAFGATSSVQIPDSASLDVSRITIELWVKPSTLPPQGGRAGLLDDNGEYGVFLAPDGT